MVPPDATDPAQGDGPAQPLTDAAWPPHPDAPVLDAVLAAWRTSVFSPARFYPALGRRQTILPDLLYYLALGVVVAGIGLFWDAVLPRAGLPGRLGEAIGRGTELSPLTGFLLSPLVLLVALFIAAVAVHAVLFVLGGAERGFRTTVRVLCFAYGPQLFGVVPVAGVLVGGVWTVVLAITGLRLAHDTRAWKASLAVLVPLVSWLLLITAAALMLLLGRLAP